MKFQVEALERFTIRTFYSVEAKSAEQAISMCQAGMVAYHEHSIEEDRDEWLETVEVGECNDE